MTFQRVVRWPLLIVALFLCIRIADAAAPSVADLPIIINVGEDETGSRLLYTYTITDSNSFTCVNTIAGELNTATVTDNDNEFVLKYNSNTGNYELWTTTAGSVSFAVTTIDTYSNSIVCTDSNSESNTAKDVTAVIVANEVLTVTNVEGSSNDLTLNALSTSQSTQVKTVTSSSQSGNPVLYTLVSDPSFSPEFFTIDISTGIITANRDLQYIDSSTPTVYLTIKAEDSIEHIIVYTTQTVHLTNQNTLPSTTNMITALQETKLESLASGEILFTITAVDPDAQSLTYSFTCDQTAGADTFTLDSNGNFMVNTDATMDYESISFFNCSFYIFDGIATGGPFIYELTVANDNEAPSFGDVMYHVSTTEGSKGSVSFDPGFTCTDPDSGDSTTYDFQVANTSDLFAIDSSGVLTFEAEYDFDDNAVSSTVILTVYCIDSGHIDGVSLTGSTQVTITITDINDNTPTFASSAFTITIDQTTLPGAVIGTLNPTDADSTSNGNITCSGSSTSTYSAYYTVGSDCSVYLSKTIDFASGTHVVYTASAVDGGSTPKTGQTSVDIIYVEVVTTTTTTTTTTTAYNFFDHGENIALFVLSLLMGLALLGLLTYCLLRLCCGGVCGGAGGSGNMCNCMNQGKARRRPRRAVTPDSPQQRKRRMRTPSPITREPRKIVQERPLQLVRTIGRPAYGGMRPIPPQYMRTPASLPPGYFS